MTNDLAFLSAADLGDAYRTKRLSPVEVVQAALSAIEAHEPTLNAFQLVDADTALEAARDSEARWQKGEALSPIDGVPASIKDLLLTKAQGCRCPPGSEIAHRRSLVRS